MSDSRIITIDELRFQAMKDSFEHGAQVTGMPVTVLLHRFIEKAGFRSEGYQENVYVFSHPDYKNEDGSLQIMEDWYCLRLRIQTEPELQKEIDEALQLKPADAQLH